MWRSLEVEGRFDVHAGARMPIVLSVRDALLELRLPSWSAARELRRGIRGLPTGPQIAPALRSLTLRGLEARVSLRGHTVAVADARPAGRLARWLGLAPLRLRWRGIARAVVASHPRTGDREL